MSPSRSKRDRILAAAQREHDRLYAILDEDPLRAASEARLLVPSPDLTETNVKGIRAMVLIDSGDQLSNADLVAEGIAILRDLKRPDTPQFSYNLANGISALARIRGKRVGHLDTAADRLEARRLFQEAADICDEASVKSAALTNQANLLKDSFRWVEAYDAYAAALKHDPTNAVALSGISNIIRWRMKGRVHVDGPLQRTAVRYLLRAYESRARAGHYAGRRGVRRVEKLMEEFKIDVNAERPRKEAEPTSPYGAFVRSHRLALCLAPESAGADLKRWDHLSIKSVTEKLSSRSATVPAMFAAWNLLKSDFLAARWLAYVAMKGLVPETGSYSDTLDYGKYGTGQSVLIIAQKATLDVLDKIAAAATDYLGLSGNPRKVYYRSRWHVMDVKERRMFASPLQWQPEVENEICLGNAGLIALSELAYDYAGGYLRSKKEIRDSATHRLIVLHEMLIRDKSNPVDFLERYTEYDFERLLVESLQVARAALFYFHESVTTHERRLRRDIGEVPVLSVPSHHLIRGEDSNIQGLTPEE